MKVYLSDDPFDIHKYELYETDDLLKFLETKYDKFPASGRIYHNNVSLANDVTPKTEDDIDRLSRLDGQFFVLIYPADPVTIVIGVIAVVATAATAFLLKPKIPTLASTDLQTEVGSSNNQLGSRQNKANLNGRIPDIYGQVRSTPDLIMLPYSYFDDTGTEYELSYMCVGRGEYDITSIREGKSPFTSAMGGYAFYGPGNQPNSGSPFLTGGQAITDTIFNYNRLADLNGDTLPAPGTGSLVLGSSPTVDYKSVGFTYKRIINSTTGATIDTDNLIITYPKNTNVDPNDIIKVGDVVDVTLANPSTLNGTYTVASISTTNVIASIGGSLSKVVGWKIELATKLTLLNNGVTNLGSGFYCYNMVNLQKITITPVNSGSLGPFFIDDAEATQGYVNIIAPSGIFDGAAITVRTTVTPYPSGTPVQYLATLQPKTDFNGFKGYRVGFILPGKCTVLFERLTAKSTTVDTDEIKIRDLYYGKQLTGSYSDVTTVLVLSKQTKNATSSPDRNFNCLAYRKIPTRISGSTFTTALTATNNAAEIIAAICLDPVIGRRNVSELDVDNIYDTIAEVYNYFGPIGGIDDVRTFNYTFDKIGFSFEETISMIAAAVHCVAYRQGNKIKLKFEKENLTASLLFNHRNILPNTMQQSVSFGIVNDYDGVKFKYIDPTNDQETILYVPNSSIVNPKDIEFVGIRSKIQAYYLAWRAWNRLVYQNIALQFEAMQESDLLIISDKVLVADLTRNETYDGEIISQVGLTLTLSTDVVVSNGDVIIFQYSDGTTGSRTILSQTATNVITINSAPTLPLITDVDNYARTTFIIQRAGSQINLPFIVTDKTPSEKFTNELKLINYSDGYYANDHVNPTTI